MPKKQAHPRLELLIRGLAEDNGEVWLEVMTEKMVAFTNALTKYDKYCSEDEEPHHRYLIVGTVHSSFGITVQEHLLPNAKHVNYSGAKEFAKELMHLSENGSTKNGVGKPFLKDLLKVTEGAGEKFLDADVTLDGERIIRIDARFEHNIKKALQVSEPHGFEGTSYGTLSGRLEGLLDPENRQTKLILRVLGSNLQVECVLHPDNKKELKEISSKFWTKYVQLYGIKHYRNGNPLPEKIEVLRIDPFKEDADLLKWGGKFEISQRADR